MYIVLVLDFFLVRQLGEILLMLFIQIGKLGIIASLCLLLLSFTALLYRSKVFCIEMRLQITLCIGNEFINFCLVLVFYLFCSIKVFCDFCNFSGFFCFG